MVLDLHRMGRPPCSPRLRPSLVSPSSHHPTTPRSKPNLRVCIIISFIIYAMAGKDIFYKRKQLRAFSPSSKTPIEVIENPFTSFKTTEIHITSELAPVKPAGGSDIMPQMDARGRPSTSHGYDQYTVTIASAPLSPRFDGPPTPSMQNRRKHAALDANSAAWGYTKVALLFFCSLLITWVPSSINRVYSLIYPQLVSLPFTYASSVVLPLMGFWNAVIYVTTSWAAVKVMFACAPARNRKGRPIPRTDVKGDLARRRRSRESLSDSTREFAREEGV